MPSWLSGCSTSILFPFRCLFLFFFLVLGESLRPTDIDESSSARANGDSDNDNDAGNDGAQDRLAAQLRCVYTSECSGRSFSALVQALSTKPAANAQVTRSVDAEMD